MKNKLLKIGELAKKAGIKDSKIDFYVREGLLKAAAVKESGYRLFYEKESLARLKKIKHLQEVKRRTIVEIKKILK